ncbi:MAG: aminotransferase class IV [Spirochaetes bacterium]|nr:aminotransferase class IV [Spirochaetota bacterium]MBU1078862.1 aminotransferase class IV [Spirochaetota bacterium]
MIGTSIIRNGKLAAPAEAVFALDDVDATYGYGCYETLKVRGGALFFSEFHEERLLRSAAILGIGHSLRPGDMTKALGLLLRDNGATECNVKVMMIGHDGSPADWYAFLLPPVLPAASAYERGVRCLLFRGERHFPAAKSLSMLLSTIAYRAASGLGCYDALLVNGRGEITEGTRTNVVYARRGEPDVLYTPPSSVALEGITRRTLIAALAEAGVRTVERPLTIADALGGGFSLALTSTSSRVMPVRSLSGAGVGASVGAGGSGEEAPLEPLRAASMEAGAERRVAVESCAEIDRARLVYDAYLERYASEHRP